MRRIRMTIAASTILLAAATMGCSVDSETAENQETNITESQGEHEHGGEEHEHGGEEHARGSSEHREHGGGEHDRDGDEHGRKERGEHDRDGEDHHGDEGEESGTEFALDQTYDEVRHGARLILKYDADSNSFLGTVENTTDEPLERVRVEVHLSNGRELGPTTPTELKPGQKIDVKLAAESKGFEGFSAHPEVGNREHGHGEGHSEHDRDGGEHGGEGGEHGHEGGSEHGKEHKDGDSD
jgi:hypothetical protein